MRKEPTLPEWTYGDWVRSAQPDGTGGRPSQLCSQPGSLGPNLSFTWLGGGVSRTTEERRWQPSRYQVVRVSCQPPTWMLQHSPRIVVSGGRGHTGYDTTASWGGQGTQAQTASFRKAGPLYSSFLKLGHQTEGWPHPHWLQHDLLAPPVQMATLGSFTALLARKWEVW